MSLGTVDRPKTYEDALLRVEYLESVVTGLVEELETQKSALDKNLERLAELESQRAAVDHGSRVVGLENILKSIEALCFHPKYRMKRAIPRERVVSAVRSGKPWLT